MRRKNEWYEMYMSGRPPWETGRHDFNLAEIVAKRPIRPCKVLEIGCGTGSNAAWLARQGFSVTAVDITEIAIERAVKKASEAGVDARFIAADFMRSKIDGLPFGFVFDRGCFHHFDSAPGRRKYARKVYFYLENGGLWLTLVGSADGPPRDSGPPRYTARDIVAAAEPYFEILSLYSSHFDSDQKEPLEAWVCLMQKRGK